MDKNKIYQCLFNACMEAYPTKRKKVCQELVQKFRFTRQSWLLVAGIECDFHHKKGFLLTFWAKQVTSADMKNPINMSVKIPKTSVSQSDEQVIGAEAMIQSLTIYQLQELQRLSCICSHRLTFLSMIWSVCTNEETARCWRRNKM